MSGLTMCQSANNGPKVETTRGTLTCTILEIHNLLDFTNAVTREIEGCVFVPRPQAACDDGKAPEALTVDQKLREVYVRLDGLNNRLSEVNEALRIQLGSDLKLV